MIKLDVVDNCDLRQIRHELWLLIKESGVVFVTLDNEIIAIRDAKRLPKILHDAPNQECRIHATDLGHPGCKRCRGRLTVSPGNHQRTAAANELFPNGLGLRTIK